MEGDKDRDLPLMVYVPVYLPLYPSAVFEDLQTLWSECSYWVSVVCLIPSLCKLLGVNVDVLTSLSCQYL